MGLVVAVPVGPLGLLCINRALLRGPWYGLFSGFGVATADALAGAIAALSISLVSQFLVDHQFFFRLSAAFFFVISATKSIAAIRDRSRRARGQSMDSSERT